MHVDLLTNNQEGQKCTLSHYKVTYCLATAMRSLASNNRLENAALVIFKKICAKVIWKIYLGHYVEG